MKLKNVQAYPINSVPDHITHECSETGKEIFKLLSEKLEGIETNIFLGGLTFAYAAMIKKFISNDPDQLKSATLLYAMGLIRNIELLGKIKILDE
jgi:hypothetical protein